jgi:hypothetical protein
MPLAAYRALIEDWMHAVNDDEEPEEDEECTVDMLACLEHRLLAGATFFADFGIWRPFGERLGRVLKFQVHTPKVDGTYQS